LAKPLADLWHVHWQTIGNTIGEPTVGITCPKSAYRQSLLLSVLVWCTVAWQVYTHLWQTIGRSNSTSHTIYHWSVIGYYELVNHRVQPSYTWSGLCRQVRVKVVNNKGTQTLSLQSDLVNFSAPSVIKTQFIHCALCSTVSAKVALSVVIIATVPNRVNRPLVKCHQILSYSGPSVHLVVLQNTDHSCFTRNRSPYMLVRMR
jgi:hypothetical protein